MLCNVTAKRRFSRRPHANLWRRPGIASHLPLGRLYPRTSDVRCVAALSARASSLALDSFNLAVAMARGMTGDVGADASPMRRTYLSRCQYLSGTPSAAYGQRSSPKALYDCVRSFALADGNLPNVMRTLSGLLARRCAAQYLGILETRTGQTWAGASDPRVQESWIRIRTRPFGYETMRRFRSASDIRPKFTSWSPLTALRVCVDRIQYRRSPPGSGPGTLI